MAEITLVLGGVRSGKSRFAEELVSKSAKDPVYIATAEFIDVDLQCRIKEHQKRRDKKWQTVEIPVSLPTSLEPYNNEDTIILVDCLSVWLSNLLVHGHDIEAYSYAFIERLRTLKCTCVLVSSEVGFGVLPNNRMAREFCDHAGILHQKIATISDYVYLIVAGLPLKIKGTPQ